MHTAHAFESLQYHNVYGQIMYTYETEINQDQLVVFELAINSNALIVR